MMALPLVRISSPILSHCAAVWHTRLVFTKEPVSVWRLQIIFSAGAAGSPAAAAVWATADDAKVSAAAPINQSLITRVSPPERFASTEAIMGTWWAPAGSGDHQGLHEADLMHTVFPHPTLSEMMHESVLDAYGRAVHY
jgi:dihydrolipoamide dehydrogenase